jgi:hypothetical protein
MKWDGSRAAYYIKAPNCPLVTRQNVLLVLILALCLAELADFDIHPCRLA